MALGVFAGAASAQTALPLTTSIAGYDVTPPLFTRVDASEDVSPDTATVEAEFLDVDSEIDPESDTVAVSDAFVSGCTKSTRKISCKASHMRSGDHSMRVSVRDRYGNRSERDHHFTVRDNAAPVIDGVIASPAGIQVKYHDPSPSSGIASVVVYLDGERLNCEGSGSGCDNDHDDYDEDHDGSDYDDDNYDEDHDGYDDDHDGSDSDHDGYYSDSSNYRHQSDGYFHDTDDDRDGSNGSTGYSCPIKGLLSCGDHEVRVIVTDKAGNSATSVTTVNSGADCTPPVTTDNAPAGWQNTDVSVSLTCTDAGSGCTSTTYEVDAGAAQYGNIVSLTTEGIHAITYRSVDAAGNVEADRTATVMIDKTPPDVTTSGDMTVEATGPAGAVAGFTTGATDALSGAGPVSCSAASGGTFPLGGTTVTCNSTDAAGNTGSASFTVTVVDTTGPAVTYSGPNGTVITNGSPTITGTATDDVGVASASVSIDGGAAVACIVDGTGNVSCPTTGLAFGYHVAVITATDAAGNTGSATGYFCKSSGAPYLTIFCPQYPGPDFQWNSVTRVMTITYTLSDDISPGAYNVQVVGASGTSNAGALVCLTPMPKPVGDVMPGSPVRVAVAFQFPAGRVTQFGANITACADDQCGNTYFEAPPGMPAI